MSRYATVAKCHFVVIGKNQFKVQYMVLVLDIINFKWSLSTVYGGCA
jgi:hypothetical protein